RRARAAARTRGERYPAARREAARARRRQPPSMRRLVLATGNPDKVREIRAILEGLPYEIVGLDGWPDVAPPEETGTTFAENALLKARYYANATREHVVAEDSGLEIDALGGAPGVESARFAGADTPYPDKF